MRLPLSAVLMAGALIAGQPQKAPPSPEQEAALIAGVRQKAIDYNNNLIDFLCTQTTRRYSARSVAGGEPVFKPQDTLTIRVSYVNQVEEYRVVRINGKPVDKPIRQVGGHRTEGEFGTNLISIFAEQNKTKLKWEQWSTINGRPSAIVSFRIEQRNSTFGTTAHNLFHHVSFKWGVEGTLEVDAGTHQLFELKFHAVDIPPKSPLRQFRLSTTYDYRKIADRDFLLPVHSESLIDIYGAIVKAETEFTDYRKFSADAGIRF